MATKKKTPKKRKATAKRKSSVKRKVVSRKGIPLKWKQGVIHPITKKPCGGRTMSQRDKKLFRSDGKRRSGTTPTKIFATYGKSVPKAGKRSVKRKASSKRKAPSKSSVSYKRKKPATKAPAKRKASSRKSTASRTEQAARPTKRFSKLLYVSPSREKFRYVIIDGSGQDHYGSDSIRAARAQQKVLENKYPRRKFVIHEIKKL